MDETTHAIDTPGSVQGAAPLCAVGSAPKAGAGGTNLACAEISSSEKHATVLDHFRSDVDLPAWTAVVDAWCALERATGLQVPGKALPARGRPDAMSWWVQRARNDRRIPAGLDDEDQRDAFYDKAVSWWIAVNPAWRHEGTLPSAGLNKKAEEIWMPLPAGLNGLTSVVACLWWWYQVAGVVEGTPVWKKMADDVEWVLIEKARALAGKRGATPCGEEPAAKRARVE
ncbi:hypothetical protein B0H14DRAFT_2424191 [Mycena olivaceomarginata]|nr:hypothetical protein B0H14DRAFT_2424191 [Mycena olivaceomarginata]